MVAKSDILEAKQEIEDKLKERFDKACEKVFVFETDWGHLRALIGSDAFRDAPLGERQEIVWQFLRDSVPNEHWTHLIAVHPMDIDEYDRNTREV